MCHVQLLHLRHNIQNLYQWRSQISVGLNFEVPLADLQECSKISSSILYNFSPKLFEFQYNFSLSPSKNLKISQFHHNNFSKICAKCLLYFFQEFTKLPPPLQTGSMWFVLVRLLHFHSRWNLSCPCKTDQAIHCAIDNIVIILYYRLPTRLVFWFFRSSSYSWHWHLLALAILQNF